MENVRDVFFFFFKQKTEYEFDVWDWSSDVCSSDLAEKVEVDVEGEVQGEGERQVEVKGEIMLEAEVEGERGAETKYGENVLENERMDVVADENGQAEGEPKGKGKKGENEEEEVEEATGVSKNIEDSPGDGIQVHEPSCEEEEEVREDPLPSSDPAAPAETMETTRLKYYIDTPHTLLLCECVQTG